MNRYSSGGRKDEMEESEAKIVDYIVGKYWAKET
jgi:hypothetical protein